MDEAEDRRLARSRVRAERRRDAAIASIRTIHALSERVASEPGIAPRFKVVAGDLESLWSTVKMEDESVLDTLVLLGIEDEFSDTLQFEIRVLVADIKVCFAKFV